jgi:hypothetical protein
MGVQFRNISGEVRYVVNGLIPPWVPYTRKSKSPPGRRVEPDGVFMVQEDAAPSYESQPALWRREEVPT